MRLVILSALPVFLFASQGGATPPRAEAATELHQRIQALSPSAPLKAYCCKVCRKGKACGDSCISKSYSCTRPRGCACDG
jgi:hypothetical protein